MYQSAILNCFYGRQGRRGDVTLREYTSEEIAAFIEADQLDEKTQEIAKRFSVVDA